MEIYVRPYPGPGGKWQVSADGGRYPRWSADGRRLFYFKAGEIYETSVAVEGQALRIGRPELTAKLDSTLVDIDNWVLSPDGMRFAFTQDSLDASVAMAGDGHALARFTFFWFDELKERLAGAQ